MINAFESPHLYRFMSVEQEASDDLDVYVCTEASTLVTSDATKHLRRCSDCGNCQYHTVNGDDS